jgi:SAM-dependent methyltransferase
LSDRHLSPSGDAYRNESRVELAGAIVSECSGTYDVLAIKWDEWSAQIVPDVREEWARKLDVFLIAGERVVELGCGTGVPVGRLLSKRYDYSGVDASAGMLAKAREALSCVPLTCADMHTLQFPRGSLGAVVAFSSISHTAREKHTALFKSIASWLRPRGFFVGNLHYVDDPDDYVDDWLGGGPMRWSGFDGATNLELLASAGLRIVESEPIVQIEPDGSKICPMWFISQRAE